MVEGPNYCPHHLHNYSAFNPAKDSIEIVNCSGRGRSQQKSRLMTNASPANSWHAGWSFKGIAKANGVRKIRVLPPNHMELQWRVFLHTKSPEEAAISVGFIKPTKQFNSFVQESSTSLINKSRDIIFFSLFQKPEMSSLLKQIILPVCGECSPSNLLSTIKYSSINIKENQRWGRLTQERLAR